MRDGTCTKMRDPSGLAGREGQGSVHAPVRSLKSVHYAMELWKMCVNATHTILQGFMPYVTAVPAMQGSKNSGQKQRPLRPHQRSLRDEHSSPTQETHAGRKWCVFVSQHGMHILYCAHAK